MPANALQRRFYTVGDRLVGLSAQLVDAAELPIDITGQTITFRMVKSTDGVVKVNGSAVVVTDAANGKVRYDWAAVDVDTVGVYYGYFIRNAGGVVATHPVDGPYLEIHFVAN